MRTCAICGRTDSTTTADHIPPKCVFGKPLPKNVITVPTCNECNRNSSLDDEYFRLLAMEWQASKIADSCGVTQSIIRSIQRPAARGLRSAVFSAIRRGEIPASRGKSIPVHTLTLDTRRLLRVAEKTIRGLFFHEFAQPIPKQTDVWVRYEDAIQQQSQPVRDELINTVVPALFERPEFTVGGDAFAYRFARDDDPPHSTAWWLEFYRRFRFVGMTIPPARRVQELCGSEFG